MFLCFFILHSQIINILQLSFFSFLITRWSLSLFLFNLFVQKFVFDFGILLHMQFSWECQKHPWTKIQVLCLERTISGLILLIFVDNLYLYPSACKSFLLKNFWFSSRTFYSGHIVASYFFWMYIHFSLIIYICISIRKNFYHFIFIQIP